MEGGFRIQTTAEADARWIADALAEYGATVESGDSASWVVSLSDEGPDYGRFRSAAACLDQNHIASVQVVMSERTYLMEGASA
jgi:hypothetical protein